MLTSGPPELPPKIGASWPIHRTIDPTSSPSSVIRLNGQNMPGMIISVLLTIPIVTDWESARGLPSASTRSPTFSFEASPKAATGNLRGSAGRSFRTAMSESGSVPTRSAGISSRFGERADDGSRASGDVVIGEDVALGRDDGSAAGRLAFELASVLVVDRDDVNADQARRDLRQRGFDDGRVVPVRGLGKRRRGSAGEEEGGEQSAHDADLIANGSRHRVVGERSYDARNSRSRFAATRIRYAAVERMSSIGSMSRSSASQQAAQSPRR